MTRFNLTRIIANSMFSAVMGVLVRLSVVLTCIMVTFSGLDKRHLSCISLTFSGLASLYFLQYAAIFSLFLLAYCLPLALNFSRLLSLYFFFIAFTFSGLFFFQSLTVSACFSAFFSLHCLHRSAAHFLHVLSNPSLLPFRLLYSFSCFSSLHFMQVFISLPSILRTRKYPPYPFPRRRNPRSPVRIFPAYGSRRSPRCPLRRTGRLPLQPILQPVLWEMFSGFRLQTPPGVRRVSFCSRLFP